MKFKANPVSNARVRLHPAVAGQPPRYVGRRPDGTLSDEPSEVEDGAMLALDIVRAAREGHLIPADRATAERCGLPWSDMTEAEETIDA
jgi:hypothetical protein